MSTLQIIRIKPNPTGKDRTRSGATPAQLGAEWVDFQNIGSTAVALENVELFHVAYPARQSQAYWSRITGFRGAVGAGEIVRVHAGRVRNLSVLQQEDVRGAHHHVFTGEDQYVWNNRQGHGCTSIYRQRCLA
jgi:hypothetical protein